ncbi:TerC/Alx family metal homeostasis membrane protein [Cellulomonas sp. ATA003]|uniref:TerC/Alx family metal homeostasis membrane protein n=1 Tax=Cellulomonas sp. ATA003 TaxID=3073064 RepID=UPI0028731A14|nr:TerC/Alx family metal homeostasis membrane protein [Cellulomonas sp. ATA003]WNB87641.1 TerC/Alx family metal homeostasis membrane protein [Cellulomonas sp. ATA003]
MLRGRGSTSQHRSGQYGAPATSDGGPAQGEGDLGTPPIPGDSVLDLAPVAVTDDVLATIATPSLWAVTIAGVLALLALDFAVTRKPHEVSMREALGWSAFYIALPLGFGAWIWSRYGSTTGVEYLTGYLVEKSLSVDNLFVFMLLLSAFAVPVVLQQRVLLFGIAGALVLRGIFIALGAAVLANLSWAFLLFGVILLLTAVKILRDQLTGAGHEVDVSTMRSVRLIRRVMPVTDDYRGPRLSVKEGGRRILTPLAVVVAAVFATDVVFAVDSVPAVYGITGDPYLVFATNAFALLGLRALYFVLQGALSKLVHLGYGLATILAFIGVKLVLHWAHGEWAGVPEIPTVLSLVVILVVLAVVTATSLYTTRGKDGDAQHSAHVAEPGAH